MCSFTMLTASTLTQNWVAGCVMQVLPNGASFLAQIYLTPNMPFYTWAGMSAGDAVIPTFPAWNATTPQSPNIISVQPCASNTSGGRASTLTLITIFGPVTSLT